MCVCVCVEGEYVLRYMNVPKNNASISQNIYNVQVQWSLWSIYTGNNASIPSIHKVIHICPDIEETEHLQIIKICKSTIYHTVCYAETPWTSLYVSYTHSCPRNLAHEQMDDQVVRMLHRNYFEECQADNTGNGEGIQFLLAYLPFNVCTG